VVVARGTTLRYGISWCGQTMIRTSARRVPRVEPDGVQLVRSFAVVAPTVEAAERAFVMAQLEMLGGTWPLSIPAVGDEAAALVWSEEPFDPGYRMLLFRAGRTVGGVILGGYDPPTSTDDLMALASIMVDRAPD
jgi:hypothetical protein